MGNRLSKPMIAMLERARNGQGLYHGLYGRSQHGGAIGTECALVRRGLITKDGAITDKGRQALQDR